MDRAFRRVAREGSLGLAATLGAANVAKLAGASLLATWHLWALHWDDFLRLPTSAVQRLGTAGIAVAGIPALLCGAAACFWAVRQRGHHGYRLRNWLALAWVCSVAILVAAWLLLHRLALDFTPYPLSYALRNSAMTLALGCLPVWWLAERLWRTSGARLDSGARLAVGASLPATAPPPMP